MEIPDLRYDVSLADMVSFRTGGTAAFFSEPKTAEALEQSFAWAASKGLPVLLIGGGSNILPGSAHFPGLLIRPNNRELEVRGERVVAGAGTSLAELVRSAQAASLDGLAWAAGIPGSVGGAVRGNAGAYGADIAASIELVVAYDRDRGVWQKFSHNDCLFAYRRSIFSQLTALVIWQVFFKLNAGDQDLIKARMDEIIQKRQAKMPRLPSAGSFFRNLEVSYLAEVNPELAHEAEEAGVAQGGRVPAAWLIDKLGLKGKKIGDAKVSLEHANFIVNSGRATPEQIVMLASYVKQQVRDAFRVQLHEEVEYVNFGLHI